MNKDALFSQQIDSLEYKVAFQEQTIEELNDALTQQQLLIDKMAVQLKYLVDKLKEMEPSNMASAKDETPPPHY
ncbi:SlyX family protein [Vibrio sp. SS-MA-C1-2]|uniref:SlyX family protein n=1 Tax=Vibrio sp. SS-MA-C1-2 TaxID=2908646 RepID=UPI001F2078FF|nr:SlyX family protein [Vibrio sp. SS-MA-C1-2]UJF19204.1 SlyX family protein [Vibrio sp. SS-MA-C1-2]